MRTKKIELEQDESGILERFYTRLKTTLMTAHNYKEEEADFETYRYILQNTSKSPKEYMSIFYCIPKNSRKMILDHLGYKTEKAFKKVFSKHLNEYRVTSFRRDQHEDI